MAEDFRNCLFGDIVLARTKVDVLGACSCHLETQDLAIVESFGSQEWELTLHPVASDAFAALIRSTLNVGPEGLASEDVLLVPLAEREGG